MRVYIVNFLINQVSQQQLLKLPILTMPILVFGSHAGLFNLS